MTIVKLVDVFTHEGKGGNRCPVVLGGEHLDDQAMQAMAGRFGMETVFVLPATGDACDVRLRYFVPRHEMEMCGHATIGAVWLLAGAGRTIGPTVRVQTLSGPVTAFVDGDEAHRSVAITQPAGASVQLPPDRIAAVLHVLGLTEADLASGAVLNAATARVKTLIPLHSTERLDALRPPSVEVERVCGEIGSTGLYPYVLRKRGFAEARQFPRSSGYPEDPATGIAAAALAFGLLREGSLSQGEPTLTVMQGRAMGSLSEIRVRLGFAALHPIGCLLEGEVVEAQAN